MFRLPISLRVVGCGKGDIVVEESGKFSCKGRSELWSPVRNHLGVEAKPRKNIGEKELSNSLGINVLCAGAINHPLHKPMVDHDHD